MCIAGCLLPLIFRAFKGLLGGSIDALWQSGGVSVPLHALDMPLMLNVVLVLLFWYC